MISFCVAIIAGIVGFFFGWRSSKLAKIRRSRNLLSSDMGSSDTASDAEAALRHLFVTCEACLLAHQRIIKLHQDTGARFGPNMEIPDFIIQRMSYVFGRGLDMFHDEDSEELTPQDATAFFEEMFAIAPVSDPIWAEVEVPEEPVVVDEESLSDVSHGSGANAEGGSMVSQQQESNSSSFHESDLSSLESGDTTVAYSLPSL